MFHETQKIRDELLQKGSKSYNNTKRAIQVVPSL